MYSQPYQNDKTLQTLLISAVITVVIMFMLFFFPKSEVEKEPENVALPDFTKIQDIKERKQAFFDYLRPLVDHVNREIKRDKKILLRLIQSVEQEDGLSRRQMVKFKKLTQKYRLNEVDFKNMDLEKMRMVLAELNLRVNVLPSSLVLAQAANESAWGRSRFAVEGNNLFGQWCFEVGCGIVPNSRPEGERYEVALFHSPLESIQSYMMNLNTFSAYESLRKRRQMLLNETGKVTGTELAEELINYSTRREEYVKEIKIMIVQNNLE